MNSDDERTTELVYTICTTLQNNINSSQIVRISFNIVAAMMNENDSSIGYATHYLATILDY
jgi:hypothetical protein